MQLKKTIVTGVFGAALLSGSASGISANTGAGQCSGFAMGDTVQATQEFQAVQLDSSEHTVPLGAVGQVNMIDTVGALWVNFAALAAGTKHDDKYVRLYDCPSLTKVGRGMTAITTFKTTTTTPGPWMAATVGSTSCPAGFDFMDSADDCVASIGALRPGSSYQLLLSDLNPKGCYFYQENGPLLPSSISSGHVVFNPDREGSFQNIGSKNMTLLCIQPKPTTAAPPVATVPPTTAPPFVALPCNVATAATVEVVSEVVSKDSEATVLAAGSKGIIGHVDSNAGFWVKFPHIGNKYVSWNDCAKLRTTSAAEQNLDAMHLERLFEVKDDQASGEFQQLTDGDAAQTTGASRFGKVFIGAVSFVGLGFVIVALGSIVGLGRVTTPSSISVMSRDFESALE